MAPCQLTPTFSPLFSQVYRRQEAASLLFVWIPEVDLQVLLRAPYCHQILALLALVPSSLLFCQVLVCFGRLFWDLAVSAPVTILPLFIFRRLWALYRVALSYHSFQFLRLFVI